MAHAIATASETWNRSAKARRLRTFLATHAQGLDTAEQVAALTDAEWQRVAELGGERPPSSATIAAVIALVAAEEAVRGAGPSDPFEGL